MLRHHQYQHVLCSHGTKVTIKSECFAIVIFARTLLFGQCDLTTSTTNTNKKSRHHTHTQSELNDIMDIKVYWTLLTFVFVSFIISFLSLILTINYCRERERESENCMRIKWLDFFLLILIFFFFWIFFVPFVRLYGIKICADSRCQGSLSDHFDIYWSFCANIYKIYFTQKQTNTVECLSNVITRLYTTERKEAKR